MYQKTINMDKQELLEYIHSDNIIDDTIFSSEYLKQEHLNDKEIVKKICNKIISTKTESASVEALKNLNEKLRDDEEIVELFVKIRWWHFEHASQRIRGNKELIKNRFLKYIHYTDYLKYLSQELRGDKEIVLMFVKGYWGNFKFASERLRDDEEVFSQVSNDGSAYEVASKRLQDNYRKELIEKIKEQPYNFSSLTWHPLKYDKDVLLTALENGYTDSKWRNIDERFQVDKDVILLLLKNEFKRFYDWKIEGYDSNNLEDWNIQSIINSLEFLLEDINSICKKYSDDEILSFIQENYKKSIKDVAKLIKKDIRALTKQIRLKFMHRKLHFSLDNLLGKEILSPNEKKEKEIGQKLNTRLKDGFTFYELIEFFEKELDLDLVPIITKQLSDDFNKYKEDKDKQSITIDQYIEREWIFEAYSHCELTSLTRRFKDYIDNSDGYLITCDYCSKFFCDYDLDGKLREKDMLVCKHCYNTEKVQKDSGWTNYEYVTSIMDNVGYSNFVYEDSNCNIDEVVDAMNDLRKIIAYGHSMEFARVLTIGYEEVDYMKKYKPLVDKSKEQGKISDEDYDFFYKLLNTSNCEYDMPTNNYDWSVLNYIRDIYWG